MTPSEKELRELDEWIDINLLEGNKYVGLQRRGLWYRPNAGGYTGDVSQAGRYTIDEAKKREYPYDEPVTIHKFPVRKYTTEPAAAMLVLEKCASKLKNGIIGIGSPMKDQGWVVGVVGEGKMDVEAETLPLAICKLAKKLFSDEEK